MVIDIKKMGLNEPVEVIPVKLGGESMVNNLVMTRGETYEFTLMFRGLKDNLTAVYFTVSTGGNESDIVFQRSLSQGVTKVSPEQYTVKIVPGNTESLPVGKYYYDVLVECNYNSYCVMRGILDIEQNYTY